MVKPALSNQVPGSMGSRNGNVVRGTLQKLGFNTTGTRFFPCSRNGTNVPGTRNITCVVKEQQWIRAAVPRTLSVSQNCGKRYTVKMEVEYLCGEGTAVENPVKSLMLSPTPFRGVIIFRDGNFPLDCNKKIRIRRVSIQSISCE
jgi:hypothetical protein